MKMKSGNRIIWLFVLIVIVVPISVFGITRWYESKFQHLPFLGAENHVIGRFSFKDQHGKNIDETYWNNKTIVANYFFTSCPAVCPKIMNQLKRVQAYAYKDLLIYSFSVDPKRDSVARLYDYAVKHGIKDNWLLLTGEKISLYRFARKDLLLTATDGDGGPDDFIHSETLVLIDPNRRIRGFYNGTDESEVNQLIRDIEKLKTEFN